MNNALMFSKASDEWGTPQDFWDDLNAEFHFDWDAAATQENTKVPNGCYFGLDRSDDALHHLNWRGVVRTQREVPVFWLNPPYSKCREFIAKAAQEARLGCVVVCLVPSRTDTRWFHDYVWDRERHARRPGVEIRFLKGRLRFIGGTNCAPFPSVVIVFRRPQ